LLAFFEKKRYINPALDSALHRKKKRYITFTSAIYSSAYKALAKAKKKRYISPFCSSVYKLNNIQMEFS